MTEPAPIRLRILLLLLASSVVAWGTSYKVSLYSQTSSPQGPVAKLLSEAERPNRAAARPVRVPEKNVPAPAGFAPFAVFALLSRKRRRAAFRATRTVAIEHARRLPIRPETPAPLRGPPAIAN